MFLFCISIGNFVCTGSEETVENLTSWHLSNPEKASLNIHGLRASSSARIMLPVYKDMLDRLTAEKKIINLGSGYCLPGFEPTLSKKDTALWDKVRPRLKEGYLKPPVVSELAEQISTTLQRSPLVVEAPFAEQSIERIAWCTGGAQDMITTAYEAGAQVFVSGEISERTTHLAREMGIHYIAAGHHATERYGVQALGEWLGSEFGVEHRFVDIDNPA